MWTCECVCINVILPRGPEINWTNGKSLPLTRNLSLIGNSLTLMLTVIYAVVILPESPKTDATFSFSCSTVILFNCSFVSHSPMILSIPLCCTLTFTAISVLSVASAALFTWTGNREAEKWNIFTFILYTKKRDFYWPDNVYPALTWRQFTSPTYSHREKVLNLFF